MKIPTPTTIQISLTPEQIELLESLISVSEKLIAVQNNTVWLTTEEAATRLKVSNKTIDDRRKAGWLRYVQSAQKIFRYRADFLDVDVESKLGVRAYLSPAKA